MFVTPPVKVLVVFSINVPEPRLTNGPALVRVAMRLLLRINVVPLATANEQLVAFKSIMLVTIME